MFSRYRTHALSIHDLSRRSTPAAHDWNVTNTFQFTTSQGGRRSSAASAVAFRLPFNSRPLKEVDWCLTYTIISCWNFQFTTSQGGRLAGRDGIEMWCDLSIHDLSRRSTFPRVVVPGIQNLSIHDLSRRSTMRHICYVEPACLSIHDLSRRSTDAPFIVTGFVSVFQFTTSQGGRRS